LRRLREAAGLPVDRVAEALERSSATVSRIEAGRVRATPRDVRDMLDLYGVYGERRDELVLLAKEARQGAWWTAFQDLPITSFVSFETAASTVQMYSALLVPGLLQTEGYAREVFRALRPDLEPKQIERMVEMRMARQSLLTVEDPQQIWVVLDEAALRRLIGGPEIMRAQLQRLIDALVLPNITVQVLPFAAGANAGLNGEFTIIGFSEPIDPDIVYIENAALDSYLEDDHTVGRYRVLFDRLRDQALSPRESAAFLLDSAAFFAATVKEAPALSVFIIYSHKDRETAQALASRLAKKGVHIRIDEGELRAGDSLIERISQAMSEVEFVVALVSTNSVKSKWCRLELSWAMSDQLREGGVRILPLRIGDIEMPTALSHVYNLQLDPDNLDATVARLVADASSHHAERYGLSSEGRDLGSQRTRPTASNYTGGEDRGELGWAE
jgi:hypothetical protein